MNNIISIESVVKLMSSQVDPFHFRPTNSHNSALSLTIFYLFLWPHDKTPYPMVFGEK